jgi:hypothetical protein
MDYTEPTTTHDYSGLKTVAALFHDRAQAQAAIEELKASGFDEKHIGIAMRDRDEAGELAEEMGTLAVETTATGAVTGGLMGSLVGLLIGIGSLVIPGVGPVIAGGVLGATLAGAGLGAAAGGVIGALTGLGLPHSHAEHFEAGFQRGGIVVTASSTAHDDRAVAILQRHGGDLGPGYIGDVHPLAEVEGEVSTPSGTEDQARTEPT